MRTDVFVATSLTASALSSSDRHYATPDAGKKLCVHHQPSEQKRHFVTDNSVFVETVSRKKHNETYFL